METCGDIAIKVSRDRMEFYLYVIINLTIVGEIREEIKMGPMPNVRRLRFSAHGCRV
jgi:hypothetical protein